MGITCTRRLANTDPPGTQLVFTTYAGAAVLTLMGPDVTLAGLREHAGSLLLMGATWAGGHWMTVTAYRSANAALLSPLSYSQLVWAALLGFALFSHIPDAASIAGMAVIICSGLLAAYSARPARALPRAG